MIAENLTKLVAIQEEYGTSLLYEGAVCGSIPIIRNLEEYYDNELLHSISGIFNGSSNYILTKVFSDHMDYETLLKIKPKIKKVITGLGTGAHLEHWGFDKNLLIEKDWNEEIILEEDFKVNTTPGRHFSGRGLKRNQILWMSFVLTTPTMKIFIGGDSGYDAHFKTIGEKYGPFDLAIIECGQYHRYWKYIHMMPEDAVQAAIDLNTKKLIPVHWGKFTLALHAWNEPVIRFTEAALNKGMEIITPMIGEKIDLNSTSLPTAWWNKIT